MEPMRCEECQKAIILPNDAPSFFDQELCENCAHNKMVEERAAELIENKEIEF